jgi:formylglycine-generating enzyme required for sulfatase activity
MEDRVAGLLNAGVRPVVPEVVNSIGMRLALIPPGRFRMGSPSGENGRGGDEKAHEVELTRPFYLGVFPVTQGQWQRVMGTNPSYFCATGGGREAVKGLDTGDFPVEQVSWEDAQAFLANLAARPEEKEKGWGYRMPSEAEWEYACRGGASSSAPFCCGESLSSAQANFNGAHPCGGAEEGPTLGRTCPVGSYRPNAWGLFDLHGNVFEWCKDWYAEDYYGKSPAQDPTGPPDGSDRVLRGGSWLNRGQLCRAARRYGNAPAFRYDNLGFRVAAVPRE